MLIGKKIHSSIMQCCDLESMSRDSSSFCPGLGLGLETWRPRSRSWTQDSMLGAYACSTITIICTPLSECSITNWNWCSKWCDFETMVSRLKCTRVHFVQVSVLVSRPDGQGLGLGLETWSPRSRSWSRDLKKGLDNNTAIMQ